MNKTNPGNFFEDFLLGLDIRHATPRTVTAGDVALYQGLTGGRFALASAATFAVARGYATAPVDDLLTFHIVFGKTVPDISLNAVANLGYAEGRFGVPVFPGDTLSATSKVIGLKENSNRQTGVVYVRSTGRNQRGEMVVDYVRWVMVRKRQSDVTVAEEQVPVLSSKVAVESFHLPPAPMAGAYDWGLAGSPFGWDDYAEGECIDHVDGVTIEEAEHMTATRLYQNTARVHFNQHSEGEGRFGRRLIYGGHIISLARALSFNGLANAERVLAINGGRHVAPCFAGDTIYAWSRVEEKLTLPGRDDVGALRLRTFAVKNHVATAFPEKLENGKDYDPSVVLDFDYTVLVPRRP
ncbi:MaoC family dehydratase [Telmatospirillum sp.]|uniref:MaoC family dehydratase n=1 Tax=Telmatospirillum sp. TaxID=2079197 RepID=UPI0028430786|nr:MaoC family dehydratase [Telmatospirillum sp.]MDR3441078.1 MaoC family dehydratase [Telmatospirillum sp.]